MRINQAFAILSRASDPHVARIIIEKCGNVSRFFIWRAARALGHGVPVAKIIHEKWFYGIPFYTNRYTLDPRPDTETLVESVLRDWRNVRGVRLLDLGTGTCCIAVAIIMNMVGATGVGIDVSWRALRVARKNVRKMKLQNRIKLLYGTFKNPRLRGERFDVITCNPPYIAFGDKLVNRAAHFDPAVALYAKHNGLAAYEQIARNAGHWLNQNGRLYVEIGAGMSRAVRSVFTASGWRFVRSDKDLGGKVRVLVFCL